jgi:transposase
MKIAMSQTIAPCPIYRIMILDGEMKKGLLGRLAPDFKTIADFRKNNTESIRLSCRDFVLICRKLDLFSDAFVTIDDSKFKGVNSR